MTISIWISLVAILISTLTFYQNLKNHKRQLRISKIEEILEITHLLKGNYTLFEDTQFFKNRLLKAENLDVSEKAKYKAQVALLIKISEEINLSSKLPRLYILNNSYMPKKVLKDKISVLVALYTSIAESTMSYSYEYKDLPFNRFPKRWEFSEFITEIQNELIEEMNLGYKNNISLENKFEEIFKKRYRL